MNKEDYPLVSIITLNWNQESVTCEFLESTLNLTYKNYEILVCDMNSDKSPADKIQSLNHPKTKVLLSNANLGFAEGNNWGMKQAKGDYIFIVNNDTEVTPDLLERLLEPFSHDPTIGVTCPKIRFFYQPDTIQYAGFTKMNSITGRTNSIGYGETDLGQHNKSGYTFGAHGCAMMVKREVIDKVGMFPAKFFLYYEEWDWSSRIMKAGYNIYYEANALIYHKESMTVGKNSTLKTFYLSRNRILFMRRNSTTGEFLLFSIFFIFAALPKAVFTFILKRQFHSLKAYLKGITWNFTNSKHSAV